MNLFVRIFSFVAVMAVGCAVSGGNIAAQPAAVAGEAKTEVTKDNKVGFDVLGGFPFTPPAYDPAKPDEPVEPRVDEQIPSGVKKLNGGKAVVTGFMLPTRMEKGQVTEFLLLRDQTMCCFGAQPQMNEWVVVRMKNPGMYLPDIAKSFEGTLKVGAIVESGFLSGIYLLEDARAVK